MNARRFFFVGFGCSLLLMVAVSLFSVTSGKAFSQETGFEKLILERLQEKNVPVKSVALTGQDLNHLEVILQSSSNQPKVAPEDPAYIHAVQREVAMLYDESDFNLDTIRITILDASTENVLYWGEFAVAMISPLIQTTNITANAQEQLRSWIESHYFDSEDVTLEKLNLTADGYGQIMTLDLAASTVESANKAIPHIMNNRWSLTEEIKEKHNLDLSILKIRLLNKDGEILLDYTLDLQLEQENWWMEDNLTTEWFPSPLPAGSP